ncbi:apoptotic chromatin condensation inducer 1b isoform X2 [Etheostoma cragini]|uniref:apoptotic chromatin condensation inducer 1b isoform X2 n=1 Tax=Etheostoma cragini TaxID=417921 RepID=UPI00155E2501|nr:apoptotic chromatin condensation inducer 1b isoform X2 [Etheostoma cragini]
MADEDITLDGKPLQSLRVADLKAALEQRNLPKSGQKNTLLKRLKGALMLENLQKSSSSHSGLQPNSQIGEEMSQNSFIKQYLAKQQELLRQRLEREAQQEEESDESPAVPEEDEDHSEDNDSSSYVPDKTDFINFAQKHRSLPPTPSMTRAEEKGGSDAMMGHGMMACGPDMGPVPTLQPQESIEVPGARMQRATFHQGHKEPPAPSPPRAVASLSVRVLGQPDRQGLPPAVSRAQEKEGTAPIEPGSAHPVLHLSRSARASAGGQVHEDSADDDDGEDESENDEDWGPGPGVAPRGNRVPPQPQQMPPSVPSTAARSKRKLQPPQHIPPPQVHHTPMQLRHPTPPPSPPPDLFPLPDTPKQSPPDTDDQEGEGSEASRGPRVLPFPSSTMQRQDSESSSRSSSPEPSAERRPGPLSLLVHKMESEGAFHAAEATSAVDMSAETAHSTAGSGSSIESPLLRLDRKRLLENREMEEERQLKEEKEREQRQKQEKERKKIQEQERQKKRLEEEKEKERKQLEEDEKQRLKEEREKERKHQEEKKDRKSLVEEKTREEKPLKEKVKRQETANKGRVAVTEARDSGSSSDSDSKSDSSSRSSQSSSSSGDTTSHAMLKKADQGQEAEDEKKTNLSKGAEKRYLSKREVSEPSAAAVTEVEPESESSMAQQPPSGAEPENSEGPLEESTTPKAFAARKISLTSSKTSPATTDGGAGEPEMGTAAGRKRRWGSSTAVTAKKPSIIITTDSLKSLIPDIKVNQEAVVELHPEELQMSGDEECLDTSRGDQDKGLKIRRTVTQVVPGDQENGQTNEEEEVDKTEKEKQRRPSRDKRKNSVSEEASETKTSVKLEGEAKKVTPSDSLVRRSISQQKSGVSVTIDDPIRATRQPSPPHGKVSNIIHVTNLVRPFTLGQLKELLMRTGSMVEEGFWIDKIKSHCYVTYSTTEEAVATRAALHGFKWPPSNPKVLCVDFCEQDELDVHKGILKLKREEDHVALPGGPQNRLPPLMPEGDRNRDRDRDRDLERDRGVVGVRDLWAEREREMERRERARGEREWDRDKVREFARPGEDGQRSRSRDRERRRRERAKSKEKKTDKKEKGDEPPVKLLDDLFLKTKAAPCIYWLPLSEEQAAQRLLDRTERQKERERRRKEQQEEEEKKREEEKKERLKGREKDTSVVVSAGAAPRGADRDRERDRGRDREGDKKRDNNYRPRRPSVGAGSGRRSRSRSNPRDRRR